MTATMNGTIISINKAFTDLTGFSKEEIVGKHFTKLGTLRAKISQYTQNFLLQLCEEKNLKNLNLHSYAKIEHNALVKLTLA